MSMINTLVEKFPIRRSKAQKEAFRAWAVEQAAQMGYQAQVETIKDHSNVVIGDPETAQAIFTAHYDTPAAFFLPNLMTPRNRVFFYLRQAGMILLLIAIGAAVGIPVGLLTASREIGFELGWLVYMVLVMSMIMGPANKHNVNDNTSGVAAVFETIARIPAEERSKAAFILFDNEEKGLLGSKAYAKAHPAVKENGFLVNLDCVGDGDHVLLISNKQAREAAAYTALTAGMEAQSGRELHLFPMETSKGSSDHKNFKTSSVIYACRTAKIVGFYCDKIHTSRDTVCEQVNLDFIAGGLSEFVGKL